MAISFLLDKSIDVVLMAVGAGIGYVLGVKADARLRVQQEEVRRRELLKELKKSLEQNLNYLNQITDYHFPRGEWPTFHLDTVWLHYFASTVCIDIPSTSQYRDKFNRLRFELDHINQKIDIVFMLHPRSQSGELAAATENVIKSIVPLIAQAKTSITEEIENVGRLIG